MVTERVVESLVESLEVPKSAYELAEKRYRDLGKWLHDPSRAQVADHDPLVFPQGSFRLGTAIHPLVEDHFDLDLTCVLQSGISKTTHTQRDLKTLLGRDLEAYRVERGIKEELEEKHRCWRLNYRDNLLFHMDTVPCIPQTQDVQQVLEGRMLLEGLGGDLARHIASLAVAITDDRRGDYTLLSPDWLVSNPEGYAKWFEARMSQAKQLLEQRAIREKVASISALPAHRWKSPLQRCVQILKRHRDVMFRNKPDRKPISIIITTLSARAYQGESDISQALDNILNTMGNYVQPTTPRVPNPVNQKEDFADKWPTPEGRRLHLEDNFWSWLQQARADFENLKNSTQREGVRSLASAKYGVLFEDEKLYAIPGLSSVAVTPPSITILGSAAPKPWCV